MNFAVGRVTPVGSSTTLSDPTSNAPRFSKGTQNMIANLLKLTMAATLALFTVETSIAGEWQKLFNGKDLSGWEEIGAKKARSSGNWQAADGILYCSGEGGGWLSTAKTYSDFELDLEFRVPADGNSGVFIRAPREGNGAYVGMEIQVLDDAAPMYANLKPEQYTGSIYDVKAASPRVTKPAGEWQHMVILCEGRHVKVTLNDKVVVDANLDDYPAKFAEHPGLKRTDGYIGLQNHGSRLDYRNLKIRELP